MQMEDHIDPEFAPSSVISKLANGLSEAVKGILIEQNYTDKDYRSTYYNYYSKKGRRYRSDCIRLHFFDGTVSFDEPTLKLTAADNRLSDHYYGFMVLRPTIVWTIGRSVVTPDIRRQATKFIITSDHKVHLLGHTLTIQGFPSMDQHRDISVCAHAACWSILRHYSVRYSMYREQHTHDITMLAHEFDPGGFIPSRGLVLSQAERIFQAAGTFPVIVPRDCTNSTDLSFYRQLIAYVESGFPLFAAMHKKGHAMAVVGFDWHSSANTKPSGMQYAWDRVRELGVVDDNHLPYLTIPVSGGAYAASDIDSFIVALPEKIFYPAEAFDELVPRLYEFEYLNLPPVDNAVTRYFVTTASAFRRFVREHESEFDPKLLAAVMELPFAQFLWIAEISTHEQWAVRQVTARAVIDATASLTEEYPFWILHDRRQAVIFGRGAIPSGSAGQPGLPFEMGLLDLAVTGLNGYSRMETNLRATHAKR